MNRDKSKQITKPSASGVEPSPNQEKSLLYFLSLGQKNALPLFDGENLFAPFDESLRRKIKGRWGVYPEKLKASRIQTGILVLPIRVDQECQARPKQLMRKDSQTILQSTDADSSSHKLWPE